MDTATDLSETEATTRRRWGAALIVTALVSFGLGVVVGGLPGGVDVGSPPAIDIARHHGWALPVDQQPAFADGEITRGEVESAIERLTACADAAGVVGFRMVLDEEGNYNSEWLDDPRDAVGLCRRQQFDATYNVFRVQLYDWWPPLTYPEGR